MLPIISQRLLKYTHQLFLKFERKSPVNQLYFAYGANMGTERFLKYNMRFSKIGPAYINDTQLTFNLPCEYQGKGFAGIVPAKKKQVYGVLYRVSYPTLLMLDILEWRIFQFYDRHKKIVFTTHGQQKFYAWSYFVKHPRHNLSPSKGYLNYIIQEAKKNNFPSSYIEEIEQYSSKDSFPLDHEFNLLNPGRPRFAHKRLSFVYKKTDHLREKVANFLP